MSLTGWPVRTWVMGREVYRDGQFLADRGGHEAKFDHARGGYWATRMSTSTSHSALRDRHRRRQRPRPRVLPATRPRRLAHRHRRRRSHGCRGNAAARRAGGRRRPGRTSCDVTSIDAWQSLRERLQADWPRLDLLVNNAGMYASGFVGALDLAEAERLIRLNLHSVLYGCHTMVPWLAEDAKSHAARTSSTSPPASPSSARPAWRRTISRRPPSSRSPKRCTAN